MLKQARSSKTGLYFWTSKNRNCSCFTQSVATLGSVTLEKTRHRLAAWDKVEQVELLVEVARVVERPEVAIALVRSLLSRLTLYARSLV